MNIEPGSKLGPYEVISRIGEGGMGVVWQGRDTRLDRPVAIKVLPAEYAENTQFRLRFEREARAISSLNHPHICTLFDVGEGYLVMELLDGESLAERLRKGALPLDQVLRFGAQIAQALEAAHRQGIVHRDLKPGNVVLTRSGAKLLDFGLAKSGGVVSTISQPSDATAHRPLTEEGTLLGTFQYMAPEQLEGLEADPRTDIFALGALLYEMATGRRAFEGTSRTSLIAAIVSADPPPISAINPITPPALDHVVRRCLQKAPDDRWQSAHDVAAELLWISEAGSQAGLPAVRTARRRTRERLAWSVAAALLIVAGGLAALAVAHISNPPRTFRTAVMPPDGVRVPIFDESPGNAVPAPDGTKVVYRGVEGPGSASLYLHDLISGEVRVLPETRSAQYPFWSPDSRWVGFFTQKDGALLKIDIAGGTPIRVSEAINGKGGSWSEQGEILFTPDFGSPISVVSASGGAVREITSLDVALHNSHRHPRFLPDGRRFLFFARSIRPGQESSVMLGSLDGGEPREILKSGTQAEYAAGALLFVRGSTLMTQRFDWKKGELVGEAAPLAEGVVSFGGASFAALAAAGEQFIVYHTSRPVENRPLEWRDRNGERIGTIPVAGTIRNAAVSPSGRFIALSLGTADETDIWILDAEGGVSRQLPSPGEDLAPAWSRDESSIVFSSNPKGRFGLYRRSIGSGAAAEPVLESKDDLFVTSALPDGSGYLVSRATARPQGGTPFAIDLLTTVENELTPIIGNGLVAAVSPDMRWIAWTEITGEGADLFVATWPALGGRRQIASNVATTFWARRGSELLYTDLDETLFSTTIEPFSPPRELSPAGTPLDASADGDRILTIAAPKELPTSTIRMIQNWQSQP